MTMSVHERTGEIGTSMALGIKRSGILRQFLTEGAMIGFFGGIAGLLIGIALAALISAMKIPMPPPPGVTHGYITQVFVTSGIAVQAFALAIVTTLIASVYPAWTASHKQIVDSLRFNR
jgi:putative ABC transport system permease protein